MAQEIADSKLLDTWGSGGTKIEPDITKIIEGWQLGEQPPHEYMNWLQNTFGSKLNHILKNGVAEWNNKTEYLAGASVQHSGNVWICKTTNTNSEPTDLSANWKKIAINKDLTVTVDTLADFRSISYPANTVWASGYHTKNDGAFGSHIFRLKGVKTTETDNGGTIIIATIGGVDYVYELQYDGAVNVKWFGAKGDGVTDDTTVIQNVFNLFKDIYAPNGGYLITTPINISSGNYTIIGSGRRKIFAGIWTSNDTLSTFVTGTNISIFKVQGLLNKVTIDCQNINFASKVSLQGSGVEFSTNSEFLFGFTFKNCGFHGFNKAIKTTHTLGTEYAIGGLTIENCAINNNNYALYTEGSTAINIFSFVNNFAGQNFFGSLYINAHAKTIIGNDFEGCADAVYLKGGHRAGTIHSNYFELNTGLFCIYLDSARDVSIGKNFYINISALDNIIVKNCDNIDIADSVIPSLQNGNTNIYVKNNIFAYPTRTIASNGGALLNVYKNEDFPITNLSTNKYSGYSTSLNSPFGTIKNSNGETYTTASSGFVSRTSSSIAYNAGDILYSVAIVEYDDEITIDPRIISSLNGGVDGLVDGIFYSATSIKKIAKGNKLIFANWFKAINTGTATMNCLLYPHGLNPIAGLQVRFRIFMYHVTDCSNGIPLMFESDFLKVASAAPISGTWKLGHTLNVKSPAAGGNIGWVCTTAGSPGTWKEFGAITA